MKVFVAGETGAIGKQLVPRLVAASHAVHGMTHSESKPRGASNAKAKRELGWRPAHSRWRQGFAAA
jgi:nucleoside-diphosphate-sugar epimerase